MDLGNFIQTWPWLYHVTALKNLIGIQRSRRLFTTDRILRRAGRSNLLIRRREEDVEVKLAFLAVVIRNQLPLDPRSLQLDEGWSIARYVHALNSRVFFWPGTKNGPNEDGERMVNRDWVKGVAMIRVRSASLF